MISNNMIKKKKKRTAYSFRNVNFDSPAVTIPDTLICN